MIVHVSKSRKFTVGSLRAASDAVRTYIDGRGMGYTAWYRDANAGLVTDDAGKPLARISYNGRAWMVDAAGRATDTGLVLTDSMCGACGQRPAAGHAPAPECCGLCCLNDPDGVIAYVANIGAGCL